MRTWTNYRTALGGGKYEIGWKEGGTVLCSMRISVSGEEDAVEQALSANLTALRERNSALFYDDTIPPEDPMRMMEAEDVHA